MREIPHSPVALYKAANLFGTLIAETILASVHVRARKQAGHMDASDLINAAAKHLARRRPSTYGEYPGNHRCREGGEGAAAAGICLRRRTQRVVCRTGDPRTRRRRNRLRAAR